MSYAFFNKFFIAGIPSLHLASIILSKVPHTQPFFFSQQADSTGYDEVLHESNKDIKELTAKQDDPWGQVSTFDIIIHPHLSPPPSRGRKSGRDSLDSPSPCSSPLKGEEVRYSLSPPALAQRRGKNRDCFACARNDKQR